MIVRDDSSCGKQGNLTRMTTSRAPNARSRPGAERLRVKVRRRQASKLWAGGDGRRPRIMLIETGFFVLVVLTTWVIASVSVWWVPVYLILLVTIFGVPRTRRLRSSASGIETARDAVGIADAGSGLGVDCANGADQLCPVSGSDSDLTRGEWVASSDANPAPIAEGTPKVRRRRVRARKAAPLTEPVAVSIPVVWIRTGPGKFVRVEDGVQAAHSTEIEDASARSYPATDIPGEAIQAVPIQTELLAEENPPKSSGVIPGDIEQACISDDRASRSVTEEDGIAPAAFSLASEFNTSVERSEGDRQVQAHGSDVKIAVPAEAGGELPPATASSGRRLRRPGISRTWVAQVQHDLIRAVPHAGRALRRRSIRTAPNPRTLVGSRFAPNILRRDVASRAFGRMPHVQCACEPARHPPAGR